MPSVIHAVIIHFLIQTPAEPSADTVSEQVIPETRKGSWFGSISRKRKRMDTTKPALETLLTEEPPNTVPEVESTPLLQPPSPTTNSDSQPAPLPAGHISMEAPKQTPLDDVPPPSWPPMSPSRTVPQNVQGVLSKPTHLDLLSPTISISSVDDFVPQPKSSPALLVPVPPQNPVPVGVGGVGVGDVTTAAVIGTSTSRFTLRIPLLGRPKIPLDQAVAVARAEDIRNLTPATPVNEDSTTLSSTLTTGESQTSDVLAVSPETSAWQPICCSIY